MTVQISKPAINLREELASLKNQGVLPKEDKLYVGELITNGTFDNGTTGWFASSSGGVTGSVVNGEYNLNNTAGGGKGVTQAFKTQIGKTYKITATARKVSGNSAFLVAAQTNWGFADNLAYASTSSSSNVELSITFKAVGEESYVYLRSDAVGVTVFDNVSVQEVGENLVTNGTFDSDSIWVVGNNASISGGTLTYSGGTGNSVSYQPIYWVRGKTYHITVSITGYVSGSVKFRAGNSGVATSSVSADGTYSFAYTVDSSNANEHFVIDGDSGLFQGSIDNVIVTEGSHPAIQSIPHGYDVQDVYIDGELAREGEAYDYQVQTNGISQWLKPTVEPTASTETVVIGVRNGS